MISVTNISAGFSGNDLFSGLNFLIVPKDRIGLVGKNGAGKSTLLKIIAGIQAPTDGSIDIQAGKTIGYLPQEMKINTHVTVWDESLKAFEKILQTEAEIKEIEHQLATRTDYESDAYMQLITDLNEKHEFLQVHDATDLEGKTEKVLKGLGFKPSEFSKKLSEFSGGWQMRVELAKILLTQPDLLLLDEPTNHLDIESILWLEDFFLNYPGALVMVSHDRMFLDNVTNRTIEIVSGRTYDYKMPYSKFVVARQERIDMQKSALKNQDSYIKQQERFIERFRAKNTKAKAVQSRIKALEKVERIEIDEVETAQVKIRFPKAPRSGEIALKTETVNMAYGNHQVFSDVNFQIFRGEKVAFVGKNGMGKTTMVKNIMGMPISSGNLTIGHNVEIGYYAQIQEGTLDPELTVLETIDKIATDEWRNISKMRGLLGAFLFGEEDVDKKVKVLSGGEKSRLAIAKLLLKEYNLLILDEPTNHLDMKSKEVLKNALINFDGTIILVSHDRDFLNGITNKTYEFIDGKVKEHLGGISEFLDKKKMDNFRQLELEKAKNGQKPTEKNSKPKSNITANAQQKEKENQLLKKEINQIEKKIEQAEIEITQLEEKMAEYASNAEKSQEYFQLHAQKTKSLDDLLANWEKLQIQLDN